MANDRDYTKFSCQGDQFLLEFLSWLQFSSLNSYWQGVPNTYLRVSGANERNSRWILEHLETGEFFNLIQKSYFYQEYLIIHNCGESVFQMDRNDPDYFRPNYNVPASVVQLTYPIGACTFLAQADYTIVGTSQFFFVASDFTKDDADFNSEGVFGFLNSYDPDLVYKIVGGLPTDNYAFRAHDFEHHFWESGYQNFSVRILDGSSWTHLTTFQVHDLSDLIGNYPEFYLFPLLYFEEGRREYSGRIAGELYDMWRVGYDTGTLNIGDKFEIVQSDGSTFMAELFIDGEESSKGMAVRYT